MSNNPTSNVNSPVYITYSTTAGTSSGSYGVNGGGYYDNSVEYQTVLGSDGQYYYVPVHVPTYP